MHVYLLDILLPQFLTHSLINTLIFEVGHIHVRFGTLNACVRDDCWHLWVREGSRYLGHDGWLIAIAVFHPKAPLHILHCPEKLVRGSRPNVEDGTLQFTEPTLELGLGFRTWTLGFGLRLLTSVLLGLGCLPLVFASLVILIISFRWKVWFSLDHPLWYFLLLC